MFYADLVKDHVGSSDDPQAGSSDHFREGSGPDNHEKGNYTKWRNVELTFSIFMRVIL